MAGQAARRSDRDSYERAGEIARVGEWELNRRRLIRLACASLGEIGGGMALIANNQSFAGFEPHSPDDTRLIVRTERPLNLESPTAALDSWLTPIDQFFSLEHSDPGVPRAIPSGDSRRGERLYAANCANCHGAKAMGRDPGPSLVNKAILAHPDAYLNQVSKGLRRMPGFQNVLTAAQQVDLLTWLREQRYPEIVSSQK